jgi:peptide deformylase
MVLSIRLWPDEVLRRKAEPVESVDVEVCRVLNDMAETMYRQNGIGLAAPQVGISRRLITLDVPSEEPPDDAGADSPGSGLILAVNPRITARDGKTVVTEGCLSFPGLEIDITRSDRITVEYQDETGASHTRVCEGLLAVCFQHEIDHLDGMVFTDRVGLVRRRLALRDYEKMRRDDA